MLILALTLQGVLGLVKTSISKPVSFKYSLKKELEHEGRPFTQGLEFTADGAHLVESSGAYPPGTPSYVRLVDPMTGKTQARTQAGLAHYFVEGITQRTPGGNWFASTYQDNVIIEYNSDLTSVVGEHTFPFHAWGFTRTTDSSAFLATNGSTYVMRLDPFTFSMQSSTRAGCLGYPIHGLNELEMVDDFMGLGPTLLGNVYESRFLVALNPTTMQCTGVLSLEGLGSTLPQEKFGAFVANGVAYNKHSGHLVLTGKNWPKMFEVAVSRDSSEGALDLWRQHLSVWGR